MKNRKLIVHGIKYNIQTWGSPNKPKIFFLHGWMDMGASFHFVCEHLQNNHYCLAPDWRGFGKSGHSPNPLGYFFYEYIADLHQILQKITPHHKAKIVGHSMGGNIACFYAGTFPERVSHLVNVEGFGIRDMPPSEAPQKMRAWIQESTTRRFRIYKHYSELAKRLQKTNPRLIDERALFLAKHISQKVKGGFQISADPRHKWIHPYLHRLDNTVAFWDDIQAKVINIIAAETEMGRFVDSPDGVHAEIDRRLKKFPKGSKKKVIQNCGHMIHHEKPKELAKLIDNFCH